MFNSINDIEKNIHEKHESTVLYYNVQNMRNENKSRPPQITPQITLLGKNKISFVLFFYAHELHGQKKKKILTLLINY